MAVQKIVYVTPGERDHNGLTHAAEAQLKRVSTEIVNGPDLKELSKVFRASHDAVPVAGESICYISQKSQKVVQDYRDNLYSNLIIDPKNINSIISSTQNGEAVIVGITKEELQEVLDTLKDDGYNVIDKNEINHGTNVYAVMIDLEHKDQSEFFVAKWGE